MLNQGQNLATAKNSKHSSKTCNTTQPNKEAQKKCKNATQSARTNNTNTPPNGALAGGKKSSFLKKR